MPKYKPTTREQTLMVDILNGEDTSKTSKQTGIPKNTIESWKRKYNDSILANIRQENFIKLINDTWDVASIALEKMKDKLTDKAAPPSLRDSVLAYNSALDKLLACANLFKVEQEQSITTEYHSIEEIDSQIQKLRDAKLQYEDAKHQAENKIEEYKHLTSIETSS